MTSWDMACSILIFFVIFDTDPAAVLLALVVFEDAAGSDMAVAAEEVILLEDLVISEGVTLEAEAMGCEAVLAVFLDVARRVVTVEVFLIFSAGVFGVVEIVAAFADGVTVATADATGLAIFLGISRLMLYLVRQVRRS